MAVFEIDPDTVPTLIQHIDTRGNFPRTFGIDARGAGPGGGQTRTTCWSRRRWDQEDPAGPGGVRHWRRQQAHAAEQDGPSRQWPGLLLDQRCHPGGVARAWPSTWSTHGRLIAVAVALVAIALVARFFYYRSTHVYMDDAWDGSNVITISSLTAGQVTELPVTQGDARARGSAAGPHRRARRHPAP